MNLSITFRRRSSRKIVSWDVIYSTVYKHPWTTTSSCILFTRGVNLVRHCNNTSIWNMLSTVYNALNIVFSLPARRLQLQRRPPTGLPARKLCLAGRLSDSDSAPTPLCRSWPVHLSPDVYVCTEPLHTI